LLKGDEAPEVSGADHEGMADTIVNSEDEDSRIKEV